MSSDTIDDQLLPILLGSAGSEFEYGGKHYAPSKRVNRVLTIHMALHIADLARQLPAEIAQKLRAETYLPHKLLEMMEDGDDYDYVRVAALADKIGVELTVYWRAVGSSRRLIIGRGHQINIYDTYHEWYVILGDERGDSDVYVAYKLARRLPRHYSITTPDSIGAHYAAMNYGLNYADSTSEHDTEHNLQENTSHMRDCGPEHKSMCGAALPRAIVANNAVSTTQHMHTPGSRYCIIEPISYDDDEQNNPIDNVSDNVFTTKRYCCTD